MDGREIAGPSLDRGVVFQGHALMPWLTVRGNIAFAVRSRWPDWPRDKVRAHVQKYVDLVRLGGNEDKRPAALSGRHEAARGHRARLRDPAEDALVGRALRGARTRSPAARSRTSWWRSAPRRTRPFS
jgi:ABC-type taurine transport system ATPase subunit